MGAVAGGGVAGTTGRGLPLEALRLVLSDASTGEPLGSDAISVEAHVSNVGWQAAVGNGGTAGTTGQARAVEALRVRLSADLSERYTVWYRVHSAEFGWLGWACDGADAGSAGYGRAVQAVQVAVLPKGDPAPGDTSAPFVDRSSEPPPRSPTAPTSPASAGRAPSRTAPWPAPPGRAAPSRPSRAPCPGTGTAPHPSR